MYDYIYYVLYTSRVLSNLPRNVNIYRSSRVNQTMSFGPDDLLKHSHLRPNAVRPCWQRDRSSRLDLMLGSRGYFCAQTLRYDVLVNIP